MADGTTTDAAEVRVKDCKGYGHAGCGLCDVCTGKAGSDVEKARTREVIRVADLLLAEWKRVDPTSGVAKYPTSYVANFFDMARVAIADRLATAEAASGAGEREDKIGLLAVIQGAMQDGGKADLKLSAKIYFAIIASLPPATDPAMVTVPGDREQLRAMSDRATPGPWAWEQCGEKEDAPVVGIIFPADDHDCKNPYAGEVRGDDDAYRVTIAYDWQWCDGHSPAANASFAVACVNYVRSILAAAPTIPAKGEAVPDGMKPWHGGDGPPDDWDGGPVLLRDGRNYTANAVTAEKLAWSHRGGKWAHGDIIAYTPKATIPATGHAATEGEGVKEPEVWGDRECSGCTLPRRDCECN